MASGLSTSPRTEEGQDAAHYRASETGDHSTINNAIARPGAVKINVQGAFIVDEEKVAADSTGEDGPQHDTRDIRLPNHTGVVSHVALDVRSPFSDLCPFCVARAYTMLDRLEDRLPSLSTSRASRNLKSWAGD